MIWIPEIVCTLYSVKVRVDVRALRWQDDVSPEKILNSISVVCGNREERGRVRVIHSTLKKSGRMQEHPTLRSHRN
jgi:hypothetical protein